MHVNSSDCIIKQCKMELMVKVESRELDRHMTSPFLSVRRPCNVHGRYVTLQIVPLLLLLILIY